MKNTKALIIYNPDRIDLKQMELRSLEADEVLIRVAYTALCGSDIKLYQGSYKAPHHYPIVIGHEWVGRIEEVGEAVAESWDIGTLVTGDCSIYCGVCDRCGNDKNHCRTIEKRGITVNGACSEYIIVKALHIYRCPELSDIKTLALTEPLAVAVQGLSRLDRGTLKNVKKVLVFGAGGIGIMSIFALLEYNIPDIRVVDMQKSKLSLLSSFGFSNVHPLMMDIKEKDFDSAMEYDLVVEASGNSAALNKGLSALRPGGTMLLLGHQGAVELDWGIVIKKSLSISGSIGGSGGFNKALQIIQKNNDYISKLITRQIPLNNAVACFEEGLYSADNIKILIDLN